MNSMMASVQARVCFFLICTGIVGDATCVCSDIALGRKLTFFSFRSGCPSARSCCCQQLRTSPCWLVALLICQWSRSLIKQNQLCSQIVCLNSFLTWLKPVHHTAVANEAVLYCRGRNGHFVIVLFKIHVPEVKVKHKIGSKEGKQQ